MSEVCGNCGYFRPDEGMKFFNCVSARHGGLGYGMQVRGDSTACEAFAILDPDPTVPVASVQGRQPVGLCARGKAILALAILLIVILLSSLLWTCASAIFSGPAPSPTPTPTSTPVIPTPAPTPVPTPVMLYLEPDGSGWAIGTDWRILLHTPERLAYLTWGPGTRQNAPVGTVYIRVALTIVNTGQSTRGTTSAPFSLRDSEGTVYSPQGPYYQIGNPLEGTLAPGKTKEGRVLFVVPTYASGLEVRCLLDGSSISPVTAIWQLPW
ncbi:MAG: DUF4352 domain-containing protein [Dehalococcoidia bacterium]|nr:DUF4352 domain-containing protein [Dehalococcoidia bacterium]